jgi:folylpolyglutamate synthase/dihydropteroate synthase
VTAFKDCLDDTCTLFRVRTLKKVIIAEEQVHDYMICEAGLGINGTNVCPVNATLIGNFTDFASLLENNTSTVINTH